jgi:hypothetical protein
MEVDLGLDEQFQEALVEGGIPATTFAERCLGLWRASSARVSKVIVS